VATEAGPEPIRRLQPGMRGLLWVAGVLVLLAGVQLVVFTARTATYFAWTIQPPLTAAFLGSAYWAAVAFEWSAARARSWAEARIAVPAVFVFTVLTLVATLLHLDKFHFGSSFEVGTQLVTWTWLAIYTVVPVLMVVLWLRQRAAPGVDPPRTHMYPTWLRVLVGAQAVVLLAVGAGLFVAPDSVRSWWPWALTTLTARAVGAWALSLGVAAAHALWEHDARRVRPAAIAYVVFAALETISVVRFPDTGDWTSPAGITYLLFLASSAVTGVATLALARERRTTPEGTA
jgi:hypothetical protein